MVLVPFRGETRPIAERGRMYVTIHLRPDVARNLQRARPPLPATAELRGVIRELGLELQPLHPDVEDSVLSSQFFVSAPTQEEGAEIAGRLEKLAAVEAAYVKPPDALPSA